MSKIDVYPLEGYLINVLVEADEAAAPREIQSVDGTAGESRQQPGDGVPNALLGGADPLFTAPSNHSHTRGILGSAHPHSPSGGLLADPLLGPVDAQGSSKGGGGTHGLDGAKQGATAAARAMDEELERMVQSFDQHGCIKSAHAVLLVHQHKHPHVLLLRTAGTNAFKLPGGKLREGEGDDECLTRELGKQIFADRECDAAHKSTGGSTGASASAASAAAFRCGEVVGRWYRPNFEKHMYPYQPPHLIDKEKERRTIYIVHLDPELTFTVDAGVDLVAVPLFELFNNAARYGYLLSSLPVALSRFLLQLC